MPRISTLSSHGTNGRVGYDEQFCARASVIKQRCGNSTRHPHRQLPKEKGSFLTASFFLSDDDFCDTTYGLTGIYRNHSSGKNNLHSVNVYAPAPHAGTATGLWLVLIPLIASA